MVLTALHKALGLPPGPITDEMIDEALVAQLPETNELEWKSELPATTGLANHDFPKDVAAMANAGGGLIVYGVTEDEKRATGRKDTGELEENHERTLRAVLSSSIRPPIYGIRVHKIGDPGMRAVAVEILESTDVPHLIFRDKYFGAPMRNDADTVWMSERELEAAYRARFDERRRSSEALEALYVEARTNWTLSENAWIIMVARPRTQVVGVERLSREDAASIFKNSADLGRVYSGGGVHPLASVQGLNPRPGLRRWVAVNAATSETMSWKASWAAVHHDGSLSIAARVGGHRQSATELLGSHNVPATVIEAAIADFMALIRISAEHLGTGEYEVRVGIDTVPFTPLIIQSVELHGFTYSDFSTPLRQFTPITSSVYADYPDDDFYWQVHDLAEDCINQGGISGVQFIKPPSRSNG